MICKVCSNTAQYLRTATILSKYSVKYYICRNCGFLQTEDPYWLEEAYKDPITKSDVGLVSRSISLSKLYSDVISTFFDKTKIFIDYGSGYGLFVRLMKDLGLNFYWYDKYRENLFVYGYNADMSGKTQYEVLTAIEVFEHLKDPLKDIEEMLKLSSNILFNTVLIPDELSDDWWYYGLDHGQHISFFSLKTLRWIASKFKLSVYSNKLTHLFTKKEISSTLFNKISTKGEIK